MTARARIDLREKVSSGALTISKLLPFNANLVQVYFENTVPFGGGVPGDENLIVKKISKEADPDYDEDLIVFNFYHEGAERFSSNQQVEFLRGDTIEISYPNTQDYDCACEVVLKEVD
jgi:hypothetical protein